VGLDIVGVGFGRTGTLSLKHALEQIGWGPCYHMLEVAENPGHAQLWHAAADGPADWTALFANYRSTVDWPGARFWREIARHFPEAKVLLTVRDSERWYESVKNTIFVAMSRGMPDEAPEALRRQGEMARRLIIEDTFGAQFEDREHAIGVYERHNQEVRDAFADSDRFLEFEAAQGWEPLCAFLDEPVPEEPFPRVNDTNAFRERFRLATS
jgi:hypothetical protein